MLILAVLEFAENSQRAELPVSRNRQEPRKATQLEPQANVCHSSSPVRAPGAQVGTALT